MRAAAKARRGAATAEDRRRGCEAIAAQGLEFLSPQVAVAGKPRTVSGFLAIGDEIDPAPLLDRLGRLGWQVALPVMMGKALPLEFRVWKPGAPLVARMWGIREPGPEAPVAEPDVLLVPLLAFDRRGYRLGYGGGYYDRTLRNLRQRRNVVAVGLAFGFQEVDAVPHLDYDERLDWVLTPEGPIASSNS